MIKHILLVGLDGAIGNLCWYEGYEVNFIIPCPPIYFLNIVVRRKCSLFGVQYCKRWPE